MTERDKLKKLSSGTSLGWLDDAEFVEDNEEMLDMSAKAAMAIIKVMKQQMITKRKLAHMLGISPQSVSKQLSGNANFTFETLQKYGKVLGMKFEFIPKYEGKVLLEKDYSTSTLYSIQAKSQRSSMRYVKDSLYNYEWLS